MERRECLKLVAGAAAAVPALGRGQAVASHRQTAFPVAAGALPTFDISVVPWSRYGSYLALSSLIREKYRTTVDPGIHLHDLSGSRLWSWNGVFRLDPLAAEAVTAVRSEGNPVRLRLIADEGEIEARFEDTNTIRLRGRGLGLRLVMTVSDSDSVVVPVTERQWRLQMGSHAHYALTALAGDLVVVGPRSRRGVAGEDKTELTLRPTATGMWEAAIEQYESGWRPRRYDKPFDLCGQDAGLEYAAFHAAMPQVPERYAEARALAAYIDWSFVVAPRGLLSRPAMYMSKNWMHGIWSWDHCFNALALASGLPDLAWDQYMIPFDLQHPQGALPDLMHDNGRLLSFVKPPIHGWTLRQLVSQKVATRARLREIYPKLAAWTEWWFTYRDDDGDGLPEYLHGNDSGWDNATVFDMGFGGEGPDLASFLVIQMDVLAETATTLGLPDEARRWRARSDDLLSRMLKHFWDGQRFRTVRSGDHVSTPQSQSLVPFLPLVLGPRLPLDVRTRLIEGVQASGLLTEFGPASESPGSPLYEADGYWRGPIWSPTTHLLVDGLAVCGARDLAIDIARRFAETCRRSGFAENYEATTGKALRDPAYTWTASTFLVLVSTYLGE